MRKLLYLLLVGALVITVSPCLAEIPHLINYQGMLTDNGGTPLSGDFNLTFTIYDAPTSGTALWTETHTAVPIEDGLFNVILGGATTPIPDSVFDAPERHLGIKVGADPELTPRIQLTSVGYAYRTEMSGHAIFADSAGTATPGSGSNWTLNNSVLYTNQYWGIARGDAENSLFGDSSNSHVNLGVACTTGTNGEHRYHCVVGGGKLNSAIKDYTTVGGGTENRATDWAATIAGGYTNLANGYCTFVGGGEADTATSDYATVAGGYNNRATNYAAAVGGGYDNFASGDHATVSGGSYNDASGYGATVSGGTDNDASGDNATVVGGHSNTASGNYSLAGGKLNNATHAYATVGGGTENHATEWAATIAGGYWNLANGYCASIGGGEADTVISDYATVAGGYHNRATNYAAAVGGGYDNFASGDHATVGGGSYNDASGNGATVSGGTDNDASGNYATVVGGHSNTASGNYSLAGGYLANAIHSGSFVWADTSGGSFSSTGSNQFLIRASGGVGIGTDNPTGKLDVIGNHIRLAASTSPGAKEIKLRTDGAAVDIDVNNADLFLKSNTGNTVMQAFSGNVGIGNNSPNYKLDVTGDINVSGNIRKGGTAYTHPDYVFEPDYELMSLEDLKVYVSEKRCLPNVISAEDVKNNNGYNMDELLIQMLEKIEEQTLYIFQLEERISELEKGK